MGDCRPRARTAGGFWAEKHWVACCATCQNYGDFYPNYPNNRAAAELHAREDGWGSLWVILATCGLRINEALSLRWTDVTHDTLVIPGGKTEAAARTVPLTAVAVEALERRKRQWREDMMRHRDIWPRPDPNLVFATELGKRQYHETTWRLFQQALAAADLPRMRQHDLRRTAVAWMREAGVDADVVQVLIGHASISTTLDLYGSINRRRIEDAGRLLNHYLEDAR